MAKWVVSIPYEGTAYIPVESDEEPKPLASPEVASKMHTGYSWMGVPRFYRNNAKVEPAEDDYYKRIDGLARMEYSKKPSYHPERLSSTLDAIADALEAKGLVKEAAEVDTISNTLEAWGKLAATLKLSYVPAAYMAQNIGKGFYLTEQTMGQGLEETLPTMDAVLNRLKGIAKSKGRSLRFADMEKNKNFLISKWGDVVDLDDDQAVFSIVKREQAAGVPDEPACA